MKKSLMLLSLTLSSFAHAQLLKKASQWTIEKVVCVEGGNVEYSFEQEASVTPDNEQMFIQVFSAPGVVQAAYAVQGAEFGTQKAPLRKKAPSGTLFAGLYDLAPMNDGKFAGARHLSLFIPSFEFFNLPKTDENQRTIQFKTSIEHSYLGENLQTTQIKKNQMDCTVEYERKSRFGF